MKTLINKIIVAMVLVAMIVCLAGCRTATNNSDYDNGHHIEVHEENKVAPVTIDQVAAILLDNSLSTRDCYEKLETEAERLKAEIETTGYIVAGIIPFSDVNGKDTDIVAALQQCTRCDAIYVITDGWQDPAAGRQWEALETTKFIHQDVHFVVPGKTEHTDDLVDAIKGNPESFPGSSVAVEYLDGTPAEVIVDNYKPVEGQATYNDKWYECHQVVDEEGAKKAKTPWWAWLLLLLLLPLLGLLIWWLLSRRKNDENGSDEVSANPVDQGARHGEEEEPVVDRIQATKPVGEVASPVPTAPITTPVSAPTGCCRCCCPRQHGNPAAILAAIAAFIAALALAAGAAWLWLGL